MTTTVGISEANSGRFPTRSRPFCRFRAHSCLCPHVQKSFAHHPDVGQCKQRHQVGSVFGQPPVLDFHIAKLAFDDPKRVFDLGSDAGLGFLQLVQNGTHGRVLLQGSALARRHGNVPVHLRVFGLNFLTLVDAPVARVSKDIRFLTVQQRVRLRDVVRVGCSGRHAVHQTLVRIRANVGFHAEMPLVALLRLVHLGVTGAGTVLGGTGCRNQGGIDHRALFEQQAFGRQRGVDSGQDLNAQVVCFEHVAKAQDGALVGKVVFPHIQSCELTKHRGVVQRFFHGGVGQVEPLLKEVNAQHGVHCKRRATAFGARLGGVRCNQRHQLGPRHHEVHLVEELALARPLGLALESALAQAHLFHGFNTALPVPVGRFCRGSLGARITGFVVEPDVPLTAATSRTEPLLERMKDNEIKNEAHAAALLGQFEQRAVAAGVSFTAHHVTAYNVSQSIVDEAEKLGCDMIVMVTEGRSRVGKFIFGSHTKDVIIESDLPVLVLRK